MSRSHVACQSSGVELGTPLSPKMSLSPQKKRKGGSKLTRGYPLIPSDDFDAYGEGRAAVETFEGRTGNIPLYFQTQSDAAVRSDSAGRGPVC